jgi:hypothetical protein
MRLFYLEQQPNAGQGRLILDVSVSHTVTQQSYMDEGSFCSINLYLTTHNTYKRQTSMPPEGFKPEIVANKRHQTLALDCWATGIDSMIRHVYKVVIWKLSSKISQRRVICRFQY